MPPVALAWALLFVIAFSVIYRFFSWLGRKAPVAPSAVAALAEPAPAIERASAPVAPAPPATFVAPKAETAPPPSPAPAAESPTPIGNVPSPAPARDFAVAAPPDAGDEPRKPLASSAVISARTAATAVRTALAPSVAATLPRLKPSVEATLPPKPAEPPPVSPSVAETPAPAAAGPPPAIAAPEPVAQPMPSEPEIADIPPTSPDNRLRPSARLLARRIGAEAPALDIRLRDTRERKIRREPKASVKAALPVRPSGKELRVLVEKEVSSRISARRADQIGRAISLRSRTPDTTKARTKIVGVSRHVLRVLEAPAAPG